MTAKVAGCLVLVWTGVAMGATPNPTPHERAQALVKRMTVDQLIHMLHGSGSGYVGNVEGIEALGIPALKMNDGPQGFRDSKRPGTTTAWPSAINIAATFDVAAATKWGAAMGTEFYKKGANVQLGPGLCLARIPNCGRNFEYISGEDPYLGSKMVAPVIQAIQSQGVIATAKHWVNNNQETDRMRVSADVDVRTQYEMYYPPFESAVKAGVGSIMCSYNKIRAVYSCENNVTLNKDLKEGLGFEGFVMSDWGATHSTSINEGLDQEMPGQTYMGTKLKGLYSTGKVTRAKLEDSAQRVIWPMYQMGVMDKPNPNTISNNVTSEAHNKVAEDLSVRSTVMLKNDGFLPFSLAGPASYAVIGKDAVAPTIHGGGSGAVTPSAVSTPLAAIRSRLSIDEGSDCSTAKVCVYYDDGSNVTRAAALAARVDRAMVFVGTTSSEGSDRATLGLGTHDALVAAVAAAKAAVVVATAPGALLTPWRDAVKAILVPFLPGQQYGNAITSILFGDSAPDARLPVTFPVGENDQGFTQAQWPGTELRAIYSEKMLFGYRWYSYNNFRPAFPFGFGLTYTEFKYTDIVHSPGFVNFTLHNTGSRAGVETPQMYITFPFSYEVPLLQLKGFSKVPLEPGASHVVSFPVTMRDLSYFNTTLMAWEPAHGHFTASVGPDVNHLPLTVLFSGSEMLRL